MAALGNCVTLVIKQALADGGDQEGMSLGARAVKAAQLVRKRLDGSGQQIVEVGI